jgi:hypothetical protein
VYGRNWECAPQNDALHLTSDIGKLKTWRGQRNSVDRNDRAERSNDGRRGVNRYSEWPVDNLRAMGRHDIPGLVRVTPTTHAAA